MLKYGVFNWKLSPLFRSFKRKLCLVYGCSSNYVRLSDKNANSRIPARVEHVIFLKSGKASSVISLHLGIPTEYIDDLIHFGAVFYTSCPPPPPKSADSLTHARFNAAFTAASALMNGDASSCIDPKRRTKNPTRLISGEEIVEIGGYARIHVHPLRFAKCYEVDWVSRVIASNEEFVVLDKPAGVSVGGTVDNQVETCVNFTGKALNLSSPLRITHQLDTWTEGCLVLAKTKSFAGHFNKLLRDREVFKLYRALSATAVPLGTQIHFMRPDRYPPRVISTEQIEGWFRCELEVLDCQPVTYLPMDEHSGTMLVGASLAYESTVRLVTGRTHQLRAQFAAVGCPLLGDSMYGPCLDWQLDSGVGAPAGVEPSGEVGLQAWRLWWKGGERAYQAGDPWWRRQLLN